MIYDINDRISYDHGACSVISRFVIELSEYAHETTDLPRNGRRVHCAYTVTIFVRDNCMISLMGVYIIEEIKRLLFAWEILIIDLLP